MNDITLNFSRAEYAKRLSKVRTAMLAQDIQTLIVHDPSNAFDSHLPKWNYTVTPAIATSP